MHQSHRGTVPSETARSGVEMNEVFFCCCPRRKIQEAAGCPAGSLRPGNCRQDCAQGGCTCHWAYQGEESVANGCSENKQGSLNRRGDKKNSWDTIEWICWRAADYDSNGECIDPWEYVDVVHVGGALGGTALVETPPCASTFLASLALVEMYEARAWRTGATPGRWPNLLALWCTPLRCGSIRARAGASTTTSHQK